MISMLMMRCSFCLPEFVLPMIKSCLQAPMLPSWRKDKYDEDADDDDEGDDDDDDDDDDDNGDGGDDDDADRHLEVAFSRACRTEASESLC